MKTFRTVNPYDKNQRTKFINKDGERFIDSRTRFKRNNHDLSSHIEIFLKIFKKYFSEIL